MIPLTKSSKTVDGDTSEHQERSLTLDLKPERPMSDDDEKPLNEKPQLDSNVVCDVSEKPSELNKEGNQSGFGGLPAIDTGLLLDVKPEQTALEECFDENPTKTSYMVLVLRDI